MSYDNLSSVSQNVLKFYQQLTGEERLVIPWNLESRFYINTLVKSEGKHFETSITVSTAH
jgi:hypothetical protein